MAVVRAMATRIPAYGARTQRSLGHPEGIYNARQALAEALKGYASGRRDRRLRRVSANIDRIKINSNVSLVESVGVTSLEIRDAYAAFKSRIEQIKGMFDPERRFETSLDLAEELGKWLINRALPGASQHPIWLLLDPYIGAAKDTFVGIDRINRVQELEKQLKLLHAKVMEDLKHAQAEYADIKSKRMLKVRDRYEELALALWLIDLDFNRTPPCLADFRAVVKAAIAARAETDLVMDEIEDMARATYARVDAFLLISQKVQKIYGNLARGGVIQKRLGLFAKSSGELNLVHEQAVDGDDQVSNFEELSDSVVRGIRQFESVRAVQMQFLEISDRKIVNLLGWKVAGLASK